MRFYLTLMGVLVLDLVTKFFIRANMSLYESIPVIKNIFHLTYVENPGAAFSIMKNQTTFFIIVTIVILVGLFYFYYTLPKNQILQITASGAIAGGAIGNLVDRIQKASVTDFFDFRVWPVFNIADSAIVIGMTFLAWQLLKEEYETTKGGH